jgi:hypothetical protein
MVAIRDSSVYCRLYNTSTSVVKPMPSTTIPDTKPFGSVKIAEVGKPHWAIAGWNRWLTYCPANAHATPGISNIVFLIYIYILYIIYM